MRWRMRWRRMRRGKPEAAQGQGVNLLLNPPLLGRKANQEVKIKEEADLGAGRGLGVEGRGLRVEEGGGQGQEAGLAREDLQKMMMASGFTWQI